MSCKRKRVVLKLADKIKIIESLEKGVNGLSLAKKYGVGTSTISEIRKNKASLLQFASAFANKSANRNRKTMKTTENRELESVVYRWFVESTRDGQKISGPMICEKALKLNEKMGKSRIFKATGGWLSRFKCRHGIRNLSIYGEKQLADDTLATQLFKDKFKEIVEKDHYNLNNVYNAAEISFCWKTLPPKSCVDEEEHFSEKICVILCSNVTGTHKIPLLLIGKDENINLDDPLVIYQHEIDSSLTSQIFLNWYKTIFTNEVQNYQKSPENVLLLFENPSFSIEDKEFPLEKDNGAFRLFYLPPNINSSHIQPIKDGVTENFKHLYKKQFLHSLSTQNIDTETLSTKYKNITLKDCTNILAETWNLIPQNIIHKSWQNLYQEEPSNNNLYKNNLISEILQILRDVPNFKNCEYNDISTWLDRERYDFGDSDLTDGDREESDQDVVSCEVKIEVEGDDDENFPSKSEHPSHEDAFNSLETVIKWFENQEEYNSEQLANLKSLRYLAGRKCGFIVNEDGNY